MDKREKIIINVGRQLGSGGHIIATRLAKDLGCKFYDSEVLNLAAKESGFSEKFFEQNDERKGFLRSLGLSISTTLSASYHSNNFSQESLFQFQSDAIRKAASESSCVFVGRCADYVLRDMPNVVNIYITSNLDERAARVAERHGCDIEVAKKIIADKESTRSKYYNYYTGKKWGDGASYDICVNSSLLGIDGTVELLENYIRRRLSL